MKKFYKKVIMTKKGKTSFEEKQKMLETEKVANKIGAKFFRTWARYYFEMLTVNNLKNTEENLKAFYVEIVQSGIMRSLVN